MLENSSKKTPAKKRQPEQLAKNEAANAAPSSKSTKVFDKQSVEGDKFNVPTRVSKETNDPSAEQRKGSLWGLLYLPVWTYVAFVVAQAVVVMVLVLLGWLSVPLEFLDGAAGVTAVTAASFVLAVVIVTVVPKLLLNRKTTAKDLGASDYPRWMDIFLACGAFVVYLITSGLTVLLVTKLIPIELNHNQELPFSTDMLTTPLQYWLAFTTLVVIAPLAEELLFRGYLYGKLRKFAPIIVSILVASIAFGLAHLWAPGSELQVMVAIDTFVISIFLCLLREYTGAIWASFLLHAFKNGVAFYFLFVNPSLVQQLQAAILPLF